MTCEHYGICDFADHIRKIAELDEAPEQYKRFYEELEKACSENRIGQIYYNGTIVIIECSYREIVCCPRFPDCTIVRTKQIFFPDDLGSLCLKTCTSLGTGQCREMLRPNISAILEGKSNITPSRPINEKFKGL